MPRSLCLWVLFTAKARRERLKGSNAGPFCFDFIHAIYAIYRMCSILCKWGGNVTAQELREKTVEMCREDPVFFTKTFVHIEDKDAEELIQPFQLWPAQEEALRSIHAHRLNVILKARQLGITWLALSVAAWRLILFTGARWCAFPVRRMKRKNLCAAWW